MSIYHRNTWLEEQGDNRQKPNRIKKFLLYACLWLSLPIAIATIVASILFDPLPDKIISFTLSLIIIIQWKFLLEKL